MRLCAANTRRADVQGVIGRIGQQFVVRDPIENNLPRHRLISLNGGLLRIAVKETFHSGTLAIQWPSTPRELNREPHSHLTTGHEIQSQQARTSEGVLGTNSSAANIAAGLDTIRLRG